MLIIGKTNLWGRLEICNAVLTPRFSPTAPPTAQSKIIGNTNIWSSQYKSLQFTK